MAPLRTCIVCRKKGDKSNFIKIVKNKDGTIAVEDGKKLDGRGAYICKEGDCLSLCSKKRALNRVFKTEIQQKFYEDIESARKKL